MSLSSTAGRFKLERPEPERPETERPEPGRPEPGRPGHEVQIEETHREKPRRVLLEVNIQFFTAKSTS